MGNPKSDDSVSKLETSAANSATRPIILVRDFASGLEEFVDAVPEGSTVYHLMAGEPVQLVYGETRQQARKPYLHLHYLPPHNGESVYLVHRATIPLGPAEAFPDTEHGEKALDKSYAYGDKLIDKHLKGKFTLKLGLIVVP